MLRKIDSTSLTVTATVVYRVTRRSKRRILVKRLKSPSKDNLPCDLSQSVQRRLGMYALAASAAQVGLLSLSNAE